MVGLLKVCDKIIVSPIKQQDEGSNQHENGVHDEWHHVRSFRHLFSGQARQRGEDGQAQRAERQLPAHVAAPQRRLARGDHARRAQQGQRCCRPNVC